MTSTAASTARVPADAPARDRGAKSRLRPWLLGALLVGGVGLVANNVATAHAPGCDFYRAVGGRALIAHAGGGLPDRKYPNSIGALDTSYAHGLRVFEMDFHQLPFGQMRSGHDMLDVLDPREAWLGEVLDWLRAHPGTKLLIDMKTDNLRGLQLIARRAPDLRSRLIPFVYVGGNYEAVRAIGLAKPVYAVFKRVDADWLTFANTHDFAAVAVPHDRIGAIPAIRHPSIVFTYDTMVKAPGARGVITNCMVPRAGTTLPTLSL